MSNLTKLLITSSTCVLLAACQTTSVSSPTSIKVFEGRFDSAKISTIDGTFTFDAATKQASVKFGAFEFNGLVKDATSGNYEGTSGSAKMVVKSVNVGTDAGLWSVQITEYDGSHSSAFGYVASGSPTADLPSVKGEYIGSLNAYFYDKGGDVAGKFNSTNGSLKLNVDFGTSTFSGTTTNHSDKDSNSVAGSVEISNGKIAEGKATYDIATKGGLVANLGLAGGAVSGTGEALFYKDSNTNFDKAHDMIGAGNFENGSTVGAFGISGGYHPEGTF